MIKAHTDGRGAKYTRPRLAVELLYSEPAGSRGAATQREAEIERLSRLRKLALIADYSKRCTP